MALLLDHCSNFLIAHPPEPLLPFSLQPSLGSVSLALALASAAVLLAFYPPASHQSYPTRRRRYPKYGSAFHLGSSCSSDSKEFLLEYPCTALLNPSLSILALRTVETK